MASLRAKLCPYSCTENSRSVSGRNLRGLSISEELISVKLVPYGHTVGGSVSVKMIKESDIKDDGTYCYKSATHHIWWYRGKTDDYPIIVHTLPDSCRLVGYGINSFGTDESGDGREILWAWVVSVDGDVEDNDILQYDLGVEYENQQLQNRIVPGEEVVLSAWLKPVSGEVDELWAGSVWWGTQYLSGGKVISVNGEYGDIDITYTVNIMGTDRTVVSSDFIEYAVGDWVFALNTKAINYEECKWKEVDGKWVKEVGIFEEIEEGWIILPIKISDYGA